MNQINNYVNNFKEVGLMYCLGLNYYKELDQLITSAHKDYFNKSNFTKLTDDENLKYYLQYMLLKIATAQKWKDLATQNALDNEYLLVAIRKHLFLVKPNIQFE